MASAAPARHRFTVDEWGRLIDLGFFREDDRVELIEGEMIDMTPIGDRHAACVARLNHLFHQRVGDAAVVWVQAPVRLGQLSEPEPDVAILRFQPDFYASGKPGAADSLLLIEVADSSLGYDRDRKGLLYARSGVPEYWIIDLTTDSVLVLADPGPDGYRSVASASPGESLSPRLLPQLTIPTSEALGI